MKPKRERNWNSKLSQHSKLQGSWFRGTPKHVQLDTWPRSLAFWQRGRQGSRGIQPTDLLSTSCRTWHCGLVRPLSCLLNRSQPVGISIGIPSTSTKAGSTLLSLKIGPSCYIFCFQQAPNIIRKVDVFWGRGVYVEEVWWPYMQDVPSETPLQSLFSP